MLTDEQIQKNKTQFIEWLNKLSIEGANVSGLINRLNESDFFYAPATAIAHGNYAGGLCEHSLNVFDRLQTLYRTFIGQPEQDMLCSLIILGLLHDISKINYYEKFNRNVKNDATGLWEQISSYRVKEANIRDVYGDKAFNSYLEISKFIPLTSDEIRAIVNFNCGMDNKYSNNDLYAILEKSNLTVLLHCADMISSYIDKK